MFAVVLAAASTASAQDFLKMDLEALPVQADPNDSPFMLGVATGYMKAQDSDDGGWYIGLMARLKILPFLGLEAWGGYGEQDFRDDTILLQQYPAQASLLVFPWTLPDILRPYLVGGAGWYRTTFHYHGSLGDRSDDDDTMLGYHAGLGAEMQMGTSLVASVDLRYIFMDEPDIPNFPLEDEEFDTLQFAIGVALQF